MSSQADWEVMLTGNAPDLRSLCNAGLGTAYFRIWGGIDHMNDCPNDEYSFNSIFFDGEDDPNLVWQISYELLSLLNGASKLFSRGARELKIYKVLQGGKETDYQDAMLPLCLLGRPPISAYKWNDEMAAALGMSQRLALLILATENEDVYMLIKQFALNNSWSGYYRIMETIDSHARIKNINVNEDKKVRESFTFTANNFSVTKFDSRHGFKDKVKTSKMAVMSIDQAHDFIAGICKSYLEKAYPQYLKF
ncbi:hypothetical protein [Pseudomonas kribbensis]|uniref:Uncharacterized protein n=1 Tax=Pseudomonas kribbensis TaxID=1628086 RepID=A0A4Y8VPP0_9PSED|nr:hypothetical protein [Pseudomonas kribbensis]TFH82293.1 hypothetical protein E4J90_06225 [Pseudomonas kribbensis]